MTGDGGVAAIAHSADVLRKQLPAAFHPRVLVILGSGLGRLADEVTPVASFSYDAIPGWAPSTVIGHAGRLVCGTLEGVPLLMMRGRTHFYEGQPLAQVTFPVRVARALGVETLVVTNAAGALNPKYHPGDLMVIGDHLNLAGWGGANPLIGPNDESLGPRFLPMNPAYDPGLIQIALAEGARLHQAVRRGVYVMIPGPNFETNAELRALRLLGGDAVGMSTVPEVLVARHGGMRVLGLSCITNMAVADSPEVVEHASVLDIAAAAGPRLAALVRAVLRRMGDIAYAPPAP
ncbi:MAG TPA: purine-nucleoside phosphorylase [Chloroflexia bacterium]|nr:purine-nucleoside phosphorylase [Chloroflexia bacterium]